VRWIWVVAAAGMTWSAAAELEPVRVLEHTEQYAVVGNDQFSVRIGRTGKLDQVQAGGLEYIWLGSLYTTLIATETGEYLRAVQAEGSLGEAPPMPTPVQRGDYCEVTISYDATHEEVLGGQPLYTLTHNVQVHPGGWIRLRYECEWLQLFTMQSASLYLALSGEGCGNRSVYTQYSDHLTGSVFDMEAQPGRVDAIRGAVRAMLVDCEAGPLTIWFDEPADVSAQVWGEGRFPIVTKMPTTGRSELVYPGLSGVIALNVKLPVSE